MLETSSLSCLLEAIIFAAGRPISEEEMLKLFSEETKPSKQELRDALKALQDNSDSRGVILIETASGYQFQVKLEWAPIVARLWEEKAPRYSRALFETLALIAYRQPITRGEIEDIRGVSLSLSIFKTLLEEREWIRVVGHKEVPGRPALYATTKQFLDYFGLKSLEELPSLPEIMNLDAVELPDMPLAIPMPSTVMALPEDETKDETEIESADMQVNEILDGETLEAIPHDSDPREHHETELIDNDCFETNDYLETDDCLETAEAE